MHVGAQNTACNFYALLHLNCLLVGEQQPTKQWEK
jgi:hypothetical protein